MRKNPAASEITLSCKALKFVPTANNIDQAKLKTELEEYRRKLWLMRHFRNNKKSFVNNKFRPKPSLIQGIRLLLQRRIQTVWKKDYWTLRFLVEAKIIYKRKAKCFVQSERGHKIFVKLADKGSFVFEGSIETTRR